MELKKGYTLMHEHITIDLSKIKGDDDCVLDCFEETVTELKKLYGFGVRNIVDMTNKGMGQNPEYVLNVEKETGIKIINSTGYYKEPFFPSEVAEKSVEQLANIMIHDLMTGFENTTVQAGMIGEIGTSKNKWEETEKKVFDAAVIAHKKTNKPIYTHTTLGTLAKEQAQYFIANGIDPTKIIIGHIDLTQDLELIKEVLKLGVFVGFDTVGKNNYFPDTKRIEFLLDLEKNNLTRQVVLSEDLTRKSHLEFKGGIGYSYLFETFLPQLRRVGFKEDSINQMLIHNPLKIFEE